MRMIFPGYTRPPIDDLFAKRKRRGGLRLTISLQRTPAPEPAPFVPQPIPVAKRRGLFRRG